MHVVPVLLNALHVVLDSVPETHTDVLSIIAACASIAVAVLTGVLAYQTGALARETGSAIRVARAEASDNERHHQEALSPAVVLLEPNIVFVSEEPMWGGPDAPSGFEYRFRLEAVSISNVGFGPALNIVAKFELGETFGTGGLQGEAQIATLAANESRRPELLELRVWTPERHSFGGLTKLTTGKINLQYTNIFRQPRETTYELGVIVNGGRDGDAKTFLIREVVGPQHVANRIGSALLISDY